MGDIKLEPPLSYLVLLVPLLAIALVVGIAVDWDWRAFIVPALFVLALIPYLAKRKD